MPSTAAAGYQDILEGKLIAGVTTATTTGVQVKVKKVNGATPTWTTIAHRVKVIQRTATTSKAEVWQVAAGTSQSGQTVTLGTLTRALPLNDGTDFTGSGTAQSFAAGADVFLAWDAHDAAQSAKLDLTNTFSGTNTFTGAVSTTGSQKVPVYANAAARDVAIPSPANGMEVYLTSEGKFTDYVAGTWTDRASGTNPNASTTVAGKVEAATAAERAAGTSTGGTGALLVPTNDALVKTSSGASDENKIAVLGTSGTIAPGFLGTGTPSSSNYLRGDGAFASVLGEKSFGDGSDGAKTVSASEDLNPAGEFEYTSLTVNSSQTLGVSSSNAPLIIKVTGDVAINGTISLAAKGGGAGSGGSTGSGSAGTAGNSLVSGFTVAAGNGGTEYTGTDGRGAGGSGGSSILAVGLVGQDGTGVTGGVAPTTTISAGQLALLTSLLRGVACGAGGGGGGRGRASSSNLAGGNGGAGGGAFVMYVGGNLTLGASSSISVAGGTGAVGTVSGGQHGGAGGGGGGGVGLIIVAGTITNSGVTLSAAGGSGGDNPTAGDGGNGGAGKILIYSITTGTLVAS